MTNEEIIIQLEKLQKKTHKNFESFNMSYDEAFRLFDKRFSTLIKKIKKEQENG